MTVGPEAPPFIMAVKVVRSSLPAGFAPLWQDTQEFANIF
jgi:hypothetical protein